MSNIALKILILVVTILLLRALRYFVKVVETKSFSEAAAEFYISQSAISQQIQSLERELGFALLERKHRSFTLTPAGDFFYRKALVLLADFDRTCRDASKIAHASTARLNIGYLRTYCGAELQLALQKFSEKYPDVAVSLIPGNHEDLYQLLRTEAVDILLNDQRRAFSDEYVNLVLSTRPCHIAITATNPLAKLPSITPQELKGTPCILVTSKTQQQKEYDYYHDVIGFHGEYLYTETLEEARLLVVSGKGFLPLEGDASYINFGNTLASIPLYRAGKPILRTYCSFWKQDNSGYYVEEFAEMLKAEFAK